MLAPLVVGQRVKATRGMPRTMAPERQFVGRLGSVEVVMPPVDGMHYYKVSFNHGTDWIDHCNLEVV